MKVSAVNLNRKHAQQADQNILFSIHSIAILSNEVVCWTDKSANGSVVVGGHSKTDSYYIIKRIPRVVIAASAPTTQPSDHHHQWQSSGFIVEQGCRLVNKPEHLSLIEYSLKLSHHTRFGHYMDTDTQVANILRNPMSVSRQASPYDGYFLNNQFRLMSFPGCQPPPVGRFIVAVMQFHFAKLGTSMDDE